jgi:hypothetical protein
MVKQNMELSTCHKHIKKGKKIDITTNGVQRE